MLRVILSITLRGGEIIPHEKQQQKRWECVSVFQPQPPTFHPPPPPQAKTKRVIITRLRHNAVSVVAQGRAEL